MNKLILFAASLLCLILATSGCNSFMQVDARLDRVEEYMNSDPSQALYLIDSIDSRMLFLRGRRARYSLLKAMSLDKNFIDTTDTHIIMPAVDYYSHHGTPDDKMRTYLYLGRILYNGSKIDDAMASYLAAEEYYDNAKELKSKALLMSSISETYCYNHNYNAALEYAKKAITCYKQVGDSTNIWYTTGYIVSLYSDLLEDNVSDSLFRAFRAMPIVDTAYYNSICLDCACIKVLSDNQENLRDALNTYTRFSSSPNLKLDSHSLCAYAYALEREGKSSVADSLICKAEQFNPDSAFLDIWKYRIEKLRGNDISALKYLENTLEEQQTIVMDALMRSLEKVQIDYYKSKSDYLNERTRAMRIHRIIILCFGIIALLLGYIIYSHKTRYYNERLEILANLKEETDVQLSVLQEKSTNTVNQLTEDKAELQSQLMDLKRKFLDLYGETFRYINELCVIYLSSGKRSRKNIIYEEVKKQIAFLENDTQGQQRFEKMLNDSFDNIMTLFRNDFSNWKEKNIRFVSYVMAGFESKTIACIMGITPGSVDVKKTRIRAKILSSSSPNKEKYINLISHEWDKH